MNGHVGWSRPRQQDPHGENAPQFDHHTSGHSIDRLAALSDGTFAIVMTLLVLDLHVPVVRNAAGEKLSKQTGALAVRPGDGAAAVAALRAAAGFLGIDLPAAGSLDEFWRAAIPAWAALIAAREAAACGS